MKGGGAEFEPSKTHEIGLWVVNTGGAYAYEEAAMFTILENVAREYGYGSRTSKNIVDYLNHGQHVDLFGGQDINWLLSRLSTSRVWASEINTFLQHLDTAIYLREQKDMTMGSDPKHVEFTNALKRFKTIIRADEHRAVAAQTLANVSQVQREAARLAAEQETRSARATVEKTRDQPLYDAFYRGVEKGGLKEGLILLADAWIESDYGRILFQDNQANILTYLTKMARDLNIDIEELKATIISQRKERTWKLKLANYSKGAGRKGKRSKRLSKRLAKKSKRVR